MQAQQLVLVEDPSPNAPRYDTIRLIVEVPTYGKPSQKMDTAQEIKSTLQTGLHSRVRVLLENQRPGTYTEVGERHWKSIA